MNVNIVVMHIIDIYHHQNVSVMMDIMIMEIVNASNVKIHVLDVPLQVIKIVNLVLLVIISLLLQPVRPNAEHILG